MNYRFLWPSEAQDVTGNKFWKGRGFLHLLLEATNLQISVYTRRLVCTHTHRHTCMDAQSTCARVHTLTFGKLCLLRVVRSSSEEGLVLSQLSCCKRCRPWRLVPQSGFSLCGFRVSWDQPPGHLPPVPAMDPPGTVKAPFPKAGAPRAALLSPVRRF